MSKPQTWLIAIPNPLVTPSAWTRETCRLLGDFKQDFDRQQGAGASDRFVDSYVLMASAFLEESFGESAHWDRLDVLQLLARYDGLLSGEPHLVSGLLSVLGAFYCYLGNIGRAAPQVHARMRQLCLDVLVMGPEAACEWLRIETASRCETAPMRQPKPLN